MTAESATSFGTLVGLVLVALLQQLTAWKTKQRDQITSDKLDTNNVSRNQKLDAIHSLVNSGMAVQLEKVVNLAQQVYALTQTDEAKEALAIARKTFDDHMVRQAIIAKSPGLAESCPCPLINMDNTKQPQTGQAVGTPAP